MLWSPLAQVDRKLATSGQRWSLFSKCWSTLANTWPSSINVRRCFPNVGNSAKNAQHRLVLRPTLGQRLTDTSAFDCQFGGLLFWGGGRKHDGLVVKLCRREGSPRAAPSGGPVRSRSARRSGSRDPFDQGTPNCAPGGGVAYERTSGISAVQASTHRNRITVILLPWRAQQVAEHIAPGVEIRPRFHRNRPIRAKQDWPIVGNVRAHFADLGQALAGVGTHVSVES